MINIYNEDCIKPIRKIEDESVDLCICDPPFGLGESEFDKHYKRNSLNVLRGYREAPSDYERWTYLWLNEAKRVLKRDGTLYVFMGNSNLRYLLNAAYNLGFHEVNHLIWKYNFGIYTKKKFVTSHYHVLYYVKSEKAKPVFNLNCRFGSQEKNEKGGSLLYSDLEDVFSINKDYSPNTTKNQNKLPQELIDKLILYSSNENDLVCDFFLGNFTTAYSAISLGRKICGYEINKNAYDYHMPRLQNMIFGEKLKTLRKVENIIPANQGKKITPEEEENIWKDYCEMVDEKMLKKHISIKLQEKYQRGKFSIKNIIDKRLKKQKNILNKEESCQN